MVRLNVEYNCNSKQFFQKNKLIINILKFQNFIFIFDEKVHIQILHLNTKKKY